MPKKIVVLYLCIVATLLVASLTIKTGETKMGWNPANWSIVNDLQGQTNYEKPAQSGLLSNTGGGGGGGGGNTYQATSPSTMPPRMPGADQQALYDRLEQEMYGPTPEEQAAAAAQAAQQQAARNSFNSGRTNIFDSATSAAGNAVRDQRGGILNFIESLRNSQEDIDQGRIKSQLGKERASTGIMGMVGRGIRSGGTMLANRNAGDSSAAGAIAQAYGDLGNRQQSDVNNQYGMEQEDLNLSQGRLGRQRESGLRDIGSAREGAVYNIVESAKQSFAALNDQAAGAGIEDRIAIEQEKEAIRNQTLQQLAVLDQEVAKVGGVKAMGGDAIRSKAGELNRLGQGQASQYSFTDQAPAQFQQGAQLGQLPIYSNRRRQA